MTNNYCFIKGNKVEKPQHNCTYVVVFMLTAIYVLIIEEIALFFKVLSCKKKKVILA